MKYLFGIFFIFLVLYSCSKLNNSTAIQDVIYGLQTDSTTILADGTSLVHISCSLDSMATSDRRGVLFRISSGTFAGTTDTTIVAQAQFVGQSLIATQVIQVPQIPGKLMITAQPSLPGVQYNNFILKDSVQLRPSVPYKINLIGNTSGIVSNYGSQVNLIGYVYNYAGGKVSLGYKVDFEDSLAGPVPANGNWSMAVDTINALSQVTAAYSYGAAAVGTPIYITCTLFDSMNAKLPVIGKTIVYINK